MTTTKCAAIALLGALAIGCGSFFGGGGEGREQPDGGDGGDDDGGNGGGPCTPGTNVACRCDDARQGAALCLGDRTLGPCVCRDDPGVVPCRTDADCSDALPRCAGGVCVAAPRECADDGECAQAERCQLGVCVPDDAVGARCGDGHVDDGEECDDGEGNSDRVADACRLDCRRAGCGDRARDSGEECDGRDLGGQTCATLLPGTTGTLRCVECRLDDSGCEEPGGGVCGDGTVDVGEQCDDGAANSNTRRDACRTNCRRARCGDGVMDTGEACDGADFGGATCGSLGHTGGSLRCDGACQRSEADCTDDGPGLGPDEQCERTVDCRDGLLCVSSDGGLTGRCRFTCTETSACPRTYTCAALQGGGGACVPEADVPRPAEGEACDAQSGCDTGLRCLIGVGATEGVCRRTCSTNAQCAEGQTCQAPSDGGGRVCLTAPARGGMCAACSTNTDCDADAGLACISTILGAICTKSCQDATECPTPAICGPGNICMCLN